MSDYREKSHQEHVNVLVWIFIVSVVAIFWATSRHEDEIRQQHHNRMAAVQNAIAEARSEFDDLKNVVDRFEDDDWAEVVPEVREAVESLDSALSDAETADSAFSDAEAAATD